jgi:hypothetical protein
MALPQSYVDPQRFLMNLAFDEDRTPESNILKGKLEMKEEASDIINDPREEMMIRTREIIKDDPLREEKEFMDELLKNNLNYSTLKVIAQKQKSHDEIMAALRQSDAIERMKFGGQFRKFPADMIDKQKKGLFQTQRFNKAQLEKYNTIPFMSY